jgi:hypothetical protein
MNPAQIALIVQAIQAAIAAAPRVVSVIQSAKDFIGSLFSAGLIGKDVQDRIHNHVDAICNAAIAGTELPEWTVEADPS